jgi:hypothetical protein
MIMNSTTCENSPQSPNPPQSLLATHFESQNCPGLDMRIRPKRMSLEDLRAQLESVFCYYRGAKRHALSGLVHLWHDHWHEAHALAQAFEGDPDCDLVHYLLHRRESDASNSRYWARSAGNHSAYTPIAAAVAPILASTAWEKRLVKNAKWMPEAFIDAACRHPQDPILIRVQAVEMIAILQMWWPEKDAPKP